MSRRRAPRAIDDAARFEEAIAKGPPYHVLKLYVAGSTKRSTEAVASIRSVCEEHLSGRYQLQVIDIYKQPVLARGEQIVAVPTLIRFLPLPLRRLIGDLSSEERILVGLDLQPGSGGEGR